MKPRTQPHDDQLERSVLGAAMHFPGDCAIALDALRPEDFHSPHCRELFEVIAKIAPGLQHAIDPALLRQAAKTRPNALALFDTLEPSIAHDCEQSCRMLRALSDARRLLRAAFEVAAAGTDLEASRDPEAFLDRASKLLTQALAERETEVAALQIGPLAEYLASELVQNRAIPATQRHRTGLRALDGMSGGLAGGRLYVVAGRPGMGKSALAVQVAEAVAEQGRRAIVYSLEMPPEELRDRVVAGRARVDGRLVEARSLCPNDVQRVVRTVNAMTDMPLFVVDASTLRLEQICRHARREHMRNPLGVILIDYLQLLRSGQRHQDREAEVSTISRELKLLSRELSVPVIAVAQLNREVEKRADKRPLLSDLRESGAIEQDADAVWFIYRDDYYNQNSQAPGVAEVIVAKNRGGQTGIVRTRWEAPFTRFADLMGAVS